jgi:hypothetical protein
MSKWKNKKMKFILYSALIIVFCTMCSRNKEVPEAYYKKFSTSFESVNDFSGFYIVPQNYKNTCSHQISNELIHSGNFSHKAWIFGANPESSLLQNNNHRAYPTIQFHKTADGVFRTPCYITFWVWADIKLEPHSPENQWLSLATFSTDSSDNWSRTILANLSYDGFVHLMHVPVQGKQDYLFQSTTVKFPMKQWVEIKIFLDTRPGTGYAKIWQNGTLISYAKIADGNGMLAQAHFGLYAAPSVSKGVIFNDDLEIREVDRE